MYVYIIVHVEVPVQTVKEQHGLEGMCSYLSVVRMPYKAKLFVNNKVNINKYVSPGRETYSGQPVHPTASGDRVAIPTPSSLILF